MEPAEIQIETEFRLCETHLREATGFTSFDPIGATQVELRSNKTYILLLLVAHAVFGISHATTPGQYDLGSAGAKTIGVKHVIARGRLEDESQLPGNTIVRRSTEDNGWKMNCGTYINQNCIRDRIGDWGVLRCDVSCICVPQIDERKLPAFVDIPWRKTWHAVAYGGESQWRHHELKRRSDDGVHAIHMWASDVDRYQGLTDQDIKTFALVIARKAINQAHWCGWIWDIGGRGYHWLMALSTDHKGEALYCDGNHQWLVEPTVAQYEWQGDDYVFTGTTTGYGGVYELGQTTRNNDLPVTTRNNDLSVHTV
ncbi:hypothetical protein BC829DRAFT_438070 [Chytridium lagenaria]|nr:hypothetical protein BC829DRAFT_438070 [Chytridium lagenaria]